MNTNQASTSNSVPVRERVAIIGAGSLGKAVAALMSRSGVDIAVWARSEEKQQEFATKFPRALVSTSLDEVAAQATLFFFAIPGYAFAEVIDLYSPIAQPDHAVIHGARGVGTGFILPHTLFLQKTCVRQIGVLGGPVFIDAIQEGRPIVAVLASRFPQVQRDITTLMSHTSVRIHNSNDMAGVEIAGAVGNVAALAIGMAQELDLGDMAIGLLQTRSWNEAARLGSLYRADPATFTGLAGVGEMIPRPVAPARHNRSVGAYLAQGKTWLDACALVEGAAEGGHTALEADIVCQRRKLSVPLIHAVARVVRGEELARDALRAVLRLDLDIDARSSTRTAIDESA